MVAGRRVPPAAVPARRQGVPAVQGRPRRRRLQAHRQPGGPVAVAAQFDDTLLRTGSATARAATSKTPGSPASNGSSTSTPPATSAPRRSTPSARSASRQGLPHAGEMAMDARAVELHQPGVRHATAAPNPSRSEGTVREAALELADHPARLHRVTRPGRNRNKYGDLVRHGRPTLVRHVLHLGLRDLRRRPHRHLRQRRRITPTARTSSPTPAANRNGLRTTDDPDPRRPRPLRLVMGQRVRPHRPLREMGERPGVPGDRRQHLAPSNNSNGGQVMRRTRSKYGQGTVFVRVEE